MNLQKQAGVPRHDRAAGSALVGAAAATALAMSHHPTTWGQSGDMAWIVHGVLILFLALTAFGLIRFAYRLGMMKTAVLGGVIAYAISIFANLGAVTISGFITPALADRGIVTDSPSILLLTWEANQALSRVGVFAAGAAFALWSVELLRRTDWDDRGVGALGLFAGSLPAALLALGWLNMNVGGASVIYAIHVAWTALVGLQLYRGKPHPM